MRGRSVWIVVGPLVVWPVRVHAQAPPPAVPVETAPQESNDVAPAAEPAAPSEKSGVSDAAEAEPERDDVPGESAAAPAPPSASRDAEKEKAVPSPSATPPAPTAASQGSPAAREARATVNARTPKQAEAVGSDNGVEEEFRLPPRRGTWIGLELSAAMNLSARFPTVDRSSETERITDSTLAAGLTLDFDQVWALLLGYEYAGLGKERFEIASDGSALDVRYAVDTLWLGARLYFDAERPSWFAHAGLGAALQRVHGAGTRTEASFNAPGEPFACTESGGLGGAARLGVGGEVDLAERFSFVSDLTAVGYLLPGGVDSVGACAPGAGPAIQGLARLGLQYRLPL